jgi:hypothetical protein
MEGQYFGEVTKLHTPHALCILTNLHCFVSGFNFRLFFQTSVDERL